MISSFCNSIIFLHELDACLRLIIPQVQGLVGCSSSGLTHLTLQCLRALVAFSVPTRWIASGSRPLRTALHPAERLLFGKRSWVGAAVD